MKEEGSPVDIVSWGFQEYMRYEIDVLACRKTWCSCVVERARFGAGFAKGAKGSKDESLTLKMQDKSGRSPTQPAEKGVCTQENRAKGIEGREEEKKQKRCRLKDRRRLRIRQSWRHTDGHVISRPLKSVTGGE